MITVRKHLNLGTVFWLLFFCAVYLRTGNAYLQLPVTLAGGVMMLCALSVKQMLREKALIPSVVLVASAAVSILKTNNIEFYYVAFLIGNIGAAYYISRRHKTRCFYKWLLLATILFYFIHYIIKGSFAALYNLASENTVTIYLILLYCLYAREGRAVNREPSLLLAACCCLLGVLSNSRTGMVCGAILFVGIVFIRLSKNSKGRKICAGIIAGGCVIAVLAFVFFAPKIIAVLYDPPRVFMWKLYLSKITTLKDVLLGGDFAGEGVEYIIAYHGNLHNTFLNIHARYGMAALLAVIWMFLVGVKHTVRKKDWCGVLCLLLYFMRSLTDNTSFIGAMDFLVMTLYFDAVRPPEVQEKEDEKPRVLFLINTIPQIINCATLCSTAFHEGYHVTICLMDSLYRRFGKALSASPLFERVQSNEWVESGVKKGSRTYKRICDLLDYYRIESACSELEADYDYIFAAGPNLRNLELYYYLNRKHPAQLVFFEEGIAEYHFLEVERPRSELLASKLVFGSYYKENITGVYVYAPYLALKGNGEIPFHAISVPQGEAEKELQALIANMFPDFSAQELDLRGKVVYLDQPYDIDAPGSVMHIKTEEAFAALRKIVGDDHIYIKLHPRSLPEKYGISVTYLPQGIPFEVLYDAVRHEECTVVSACSSAALNVMLKYGDESHAVLLYRIIVGDVGGQFGELVKRFNHHVEKTGGRQIQMPGSLEELKLQLAEIQQEASGK